MSRTPLLAAVLCLALPACTKRPKTDPLLAEVTTPIHVTVRAHTLRGSCTGREGFDRVQCWFAGSRAGVTYLEVGAAADAPLDPSVDPDAVVRLSAFGARVSLENTVLRNVAVQVDDRGERVAVFNGGGWFVYFLEDGQVLSRTSVARPTLDWSAFPIEAQFNDMLIHARGAQRERLLRRQQASFGEPGLIDYLSTLPDNRQEWDLLYATLSPVGRDAVEKRLVDQLDGGEGPWEFFLTRPQLQPRDFSERVAAQALSLTAEGDGAWVWPQLVRSHHPAAAALACEAIHRAFIESLFSNETMGEVIVDPLQANTGPLAVIALTHGSCDWVTRWVDDWVCGAPLTCPPPQPSGEEDPDSAGLSGEQPHDNDPLCTAADVDAGLTRWLAQTEPLQLGATDGGEADEASDETPPPLGALFVGAMLVQDRQPVLTRRQRATYAVMTPKGSTKPEDLDPACRTLVDQQVFRSLCSLPMNLTEFDFRGCHVKVDDARKRVVLHEVK